MVYIERHLHICLVSGDKKSTLGKNTNEKKSIRYQLCCINCAIASEDEYVASFVKRRLQFCKGIISMYNKNNVFPCVIFFYRYILIGWMQYN